MALSHLEPGYLDIKVNAMKSTIITAAVLFFLSAPLAVLAEVPLVAATLSGVEETVAESSDQQAVAEMLSEVAVTTAGSVESQVLTKVPAVAVAPAAPGQPCPMHGMGNMHRGMGQGGMGPGSKKPGCDCGGKRQQDKHQQVVQRLDMIEARIAKIELMLESLMRR